LVTAHQPHLSKVAIGMEGEDSTQRGASNDLGYRSPFAPPRDPEWRMLYTQEQLYRMEQRSQEHLAQQASHSEPVAMDSITGEHADTWRNVAHPPNLFPYREWPVEDPNPELAQRTNRISRLWFFIIASFPLFWPFFPFYASGRIDPLVQEFTGGQILGFSNYWKYQAWKATYTCLVLVFAASPALTIWAFVKWG